MRRQRIVSILVIIFLMGILLSCNSTHTTIQEEETLIGPLTFDLVESNKEYDLLNNNTTSPSIVRSINDHSYLIDNNGVYQFVTNGEVVWEKDAIVCSSENSCKKVLYVDQVLKETKEITFIKHEDNFLSYIKKIDEYGSEVWSVGPFKYFEYFMNNYHFRDENNEIKVINLNVNDGSYSIGPFFSKTVGDNKISIEQEGFDYYLVNHGLNGIEKWRKGPFTTLDQHMIFTKDYIFFRSEVKDNNSLYFKRQLNVIKLDGTGFKSTEHNDFINLKHSTKIAETNELFYAYGNGMIGGAWYLAKVDSNLRELWKVSVISNVKFEIYNNNLYYITKTENSNEFILVKADINGNTIFERVLPVQATYFFSKIDQSGIVLTYGVNGNSAMIKYDHQGNEIISFGPDKYFYIDQNDNNEYVIGLYKNGTCNISLYNSDGTMLWEKVVESGNNFVPKIYGLTASGSVAYSYSINNQRNLSLINKDGEMVISNEKIIAYENISDKEMIMYIIDNNNSVKEFKVSNYSHPIFFSNSLL